MHVCERTNVCLYGKKTNYTVVCKSSLSSSLRMTRLATWGAYSYVTISNSFPAKWTLILALNPEQNLDPETFPLWSLCWLKVNLLQAWEQTGSLVLWDNKEGIDQTNPPGSVDVVLSIYKGLCVQLHSQALFLGSASLYCILRERTTAHKKLNFLLCMNGTSWYLTCNRSINYFALLYH